MTDPTPDNLEPLDAYREALRRVQSSGPRIPDHQVNEEQTANDPDLTEPAFFEPGKTYAPKNSPRWEISFQREGVAHFTPVRVDRDSRGLLRAYGQLTMDAEWQWTVLGSFDFPAWKIVEQPARTTPDNPATSSGTADNLRQRVARAIHRYDNHHALSGNDIPRKHHYGEADFVLAELRTELGAVAALRQVSRGYCPACGRSDAAPTVADWEAERQRAEAAEAALERARRFARYARDRSEVGTSDWQIGQHELAVAVLDVLNEPPTPGTATSPAGEGRADQ